MNAIVVLALLLAVAASLWSVLLTIQAYEHRRYARTALGKAPHPWSQAPRALVCVPCKGLDLDLASNLGCILAQRYPNFQVRFVVESDADPAYGLIRQLIGASSVPCEVVVAGACTDSGQKVHNLLRATAVLPEGVEVLAFFDSDARPAPDALARMVDRVYRSSRLQVATGYRWFVPQRSSGANLMLASVNAAVAGLMSQRGRNLVWGGCWAITRQVFEETALAEAWRGTLSDDLVASRVMRAAGVGIAFEPGCMAASPIDVGWRDAISFLRRQFVIGRCYTPVWWWGAVSLMALHAVVISGGLALAPFLAAQGFGRWYGPLLFSAGLYALAGLRAHWRQSLWCPRVEAAPSALRAAAMFDRWAAPITSLFATLVIISSAVGNSILWRGIHYYIGAAGRVSLLGRVPGREQHRQLLATQRERFQQDNHALMVAGVLDCDGRVISVGLTLPDRVLDSPIIPKQAA